MDMENHLLTKSLHLLGVVIFLGNIIITAVWKILADRTRSPDIIAHAQKLVTITDFAFTALGALIIVITGRMMALNYGGILENQWLLMGWILFLASGLIWIVVLIPVQIKQAKLAKAFSVSKEISGNYWMLTKYWAIAGTIATLLPIANLYFMVYKPV